MYILIRQRKIISHVIGSIIKYIFFECIKCFIILNQASVTLLNSLQIVSTNKIPPTKKFPVTFVFCYDAPQVLEVY